MFISKFFHKCICQNKRLGGFGLCNNYTVMEVMADTTDEIRLSEHFPAKGISRDGMQEQMILLNQLSEKLDEYFAMRSISDSNRQD